MAGFKGIKFGKGDYTPFGLLDYDGDSALFATYNLTRTDLTIDTSTLSFDKKRSIDNDIFTSKFGTEKLADILLNVQFLNDYKKFKIRLHIQRNQNYQLSWLDV